MRKYEESKMTRIMMVTVPHVTSGLGLRKFQADGFLLTRVYMLRNSKPNYLLGLPEVYTCLCIYFQNMFTLFFSTVDCTDLNEEFKTFHKNLTLLNFVNIHIYISQI